MNSTDSLSLAISLLHKTRKILYAYMRKNLNTIKIEMLTELLWIQERIGLLSKKLEKIKNAVKKNPKNKS